MAFLEHMKTAEVETTGLQKIDSAITMIDNFQSEVNECKNIS